LNYLPDNDCKPLCFRNVRGSHAASDLISIVYCELLLVTNRGCCEALPLRPHIVLRHALFIDIQQPDIVLRHRAPWATAFSYHCTTFV